MTKEADNITSSMVVATVPFGNFFVPINVAV